MITILLSLLFVLNGSTSAIPDEKIEYKLLATNKTSTMEKEMNLAAADGYRYEGTMGGETPGGGNEIVVIMSRSSEPVDNKFEYKLLATNKTSTMQKEMNAIGAKGFAFRGQTIYDSAFGGREVVVILENAAHDSKAYEFQLLATSRTSTMEKELNGKVQSGFFFCGVTVAETAFGGKEIVSILSRASQKT